MKPTFNFYKPDISGERKLISILDIRCPFGLPVVPVLIIAVMLFSGCGEEPSSPPPVEMGTIEIWAAIDSTVSDSSFNEDTGEWEYQISYEYPPEATATLDNDPSTTITSDTIPVIFSDVIPGVHFVDVEWGDYQKSFMAEVFAGDTSVYTPVMSQYAPDFTASAMFYDTTAQEINYLGDISLSDYSGEVVLLFYFGATWADCITREIPEIDDEINSYFPQEEVECIGIADNATPTTFLEGYLSDEFGLAGQPISFKICYEAQEAIDAYAFSAHSTWVVISQDGKITYREDDNTSEEMIDIVKAEIEALLQ